MMKPVCICSQINTVIIQESNKNKNSAKGKTLYTSPTAPLIHCYCSIGIPLSTRLPMMSVNLQKVSSISLMVAVTGAHFFLSSIRTKFTQSDNAGNVNLELTAIRVDSIRKEYSESTLSDEDIRKDPMDLFSIWLNEACQAKVIEPNAMCLSTCLVRSIYCNLSIK